MWFCSWCCLQLEEHALGVQSDGAEHEPAPAPAGFWLAPLLKLPDASADTDTGGFTGNSSRGFRGVGYCHASRLPWVIRCCKRP